jgi:hypothetical protein
VSTRLRTRAATGIVELHTGIVCVDCGGAIAPVLADLGSTRCHDCRDGRSRLSVPRLERSRDRMPPVFTSLRSVVRRRVFPKIWLSS